MILQTLAEYYREQLVAGNPFYAPQGMELKRIHFVLVINLDGTLIDIEQPKHKQNVVRSRQRGGKNAPLAANYMWDSLGYVTGYGADEELQATAIIQHRSFLFEVSTFHNEFPENQIFTAVHKFYSNTKYTEKLMSHPLWNKIASRKGHNLSFRLSGETLLASQQPELVQTENSTQSYGTCMVNGQKAATQFTHSGAYVPSGANTSSKLISFSKTGRYDSYYKHDGENAPISVKIAKSYTAALAGLQQQDSKNSVVIGNISIFYYTLPDTDFNALFHILLNPSIKTDRKEYLVRLRKYSRRKEEFILMAVIPNIAQLSIKFFLKTTIGTVTKNILRFYEETNIEYDHHPQYVSSIFSPLFAVAPQGDIDKLTPKLVIDYLNAVVTAARLPITIQYEKLGRIHENSKPESGIISLLRWYLNRNKQNHIPTALDKENKNTGYLLGRTLAILERAQELSTPGINFTIRDTYYPIVSITPSVIFSRLLELSSTYFRKIQSESTIANLQDQLNEVIAMFNIDALPARLSIDYQSSFALGYFQQRQTYFIQDGPDN